MHNFVDTVCVWECGGASGAQALYSSWVSAKATLWSSAAAAAAHSNRCAQPERIEVRSFVSDLLSLRLFSSDCGLLTSLIVLRSGVYWTLFFEGNSHQWIASVKLSSSQGKDKKGMSWSLFFITFVMFIITFNLRNWFCDTCNYDLSFFIILWKKYFIIFSKFGSFKLRLKNLILQLLLQTNMKHA